MAELPPHPHLKALGREVERNSRRVGALDELVRELGDKVSALARHLGADAPEPGDPDQHPGEQREEPPGARSWLLADDPDQAVADLADLTVWLDRVYLAYPSVSLPSCWLWHSALVEELWWLRRAHDDAYRSGSWVRIGDWHDRQRPNVVRRIRNATLACELSEHRPGAELARPAPRVPLTGAAGMIAAWVAAGRPDPAPEPTAEHLAAAEELHRQLFHGKRR
ncbi:MAG: hypothetical protein ACT4O0_03075 [Pseudonocardia sp.]